MPVLKRFALAISCLIGLMLLSACGMPEGLNALLETPAEAAGPDLRLLDWPQADPTPASSQAQSAESVLRVDLWLDASQVMGGISPVETGLYPHFSRKYREGGFHYRFGNTVGMYEGVLRGMLAAAEGSRTRILRYGNERLPDAYLLSQGVAEADASDETLRSLRRDMLTYAIDAMPSEFSEFSAENMTDSFYSLGSPALERVSQLAPEMLENPQAAQAMAAAVSAQRSSIQAGTGGALLAVGELAWNIYDAAHQAGMEGAIYAKDRAAAKPLLANFIRPGAVILVKASRGMAFEELTRELQRLAPKN